MTRRLGWMLISPSDTAFFTKMVRGIEADQFSNEVSSGFLVDSLRRDVIEARFVERFEITDAITDPFGIEIARVRVEYSQLYFRLAREAPHLEMQNAPRRMNAFMNRLGEFTDGRVAIFAPEIPVVVWLEALGRAALSFVVTGVLVTDVELGDSAVAKIAITGVNDVRKFIHELVKARPHRITQAAITAEFKSGEARLIIRPGAKISVTSADHDIVTELRECLRQSLTAAKDLKQH